MIIKYQIEDMFNLEGKLVLPDVIGIRAARTLQPGRELKCVFEAPDGRQFETVGKVAYEFINYKGIGDNLGQVGGSLIFEKSNELFAKGWNLFVYIDENEQEL